MKHGSSKRRISRGLSLVVLIVLGCGRSDDAEPTPILPAAQEPSVAPPPVRDAPLKDRIEDPTFDLALTPNGSYEAEKLASFAVTLKPRGAYHINQEYPLALTIRPTAGLSFPKAELRKKDMAEMGESRARFDVPFSADKPGTYRVETHLRFAVCTDENCVPDERALALELAVR